MNSPIALHSVAVCAATIGVIASALAQTPDISQPEVLLDRQQSLAAHLYSDLARTREALARKGITYGIAYTGDILGNLTGGLGQSAHYDGLLEAHADIDFARLAGWRGLTFHANAFQIHGSSITAENLGSFVSVSNIEALPSTRFDEIWFEQTLLNEAASVRFGELAIDTEFLVVESAGTFIASTFGWTTLSSDNLPNGGPIYPFAAPGIRVAVEPTPGLRLTAGVYNDDPIGPCPEGFDPGQCNEHGLEFRLKDAPLVLAEGAFAYRRDLAGALKLGGWYDFGTFEDRHAGGGLSGIAPLLHEGNYGLYAVFDQVIYRDQASIFLRVVASPSDRNGVHAYADAGLVFTGLVPGRPNDIAGIGFAYTGLTDELPLRRRSGVCINRNCELLFGATYAAEIIPGLMLQPLLQYIHNPGGGQGQLDSQPVEDAFVLGTRTRMNY